MAANDTNAEGANYLLAGEEEEGDQATLSPEAHDTNDEAVEEGEDEEVGGVMLGPLALRPKPERI